MNNKNRIFNFFDEAMSVIIHFISSGFLLLFIATLSYSIIVNNSSSNLILNFLDEMVIIINFMTNISFILMTV